MQIEKTADALFEAVKSYLEKRLNNLPAPRDGKDGVDGMVGLSGRDGAPGPEGKPGPDGAQGLPGTKGTDGALGEKGVPGDRGERGEKGEKGDAGERGEKGAPGVNGQDGEPGRDGIAGEKGVDGAQGPAGGQGMPGDRGKDGAPGARGEPGIQGLPGADGAPGVKGMDGEPGRDGRDGPPGRDAAQIDVLLSIDEQRSYGRGTWASHRGGLWVAQRATNGMDGWKCIVDGDDDEEVTLGDDGRTFAFRKVKSSGRVIEKSIAMPVVMDRGVFKEGTEYLPGDGCTWNGSFWIAQKQTTSKPDGGDGSFRLAVKRGRDGRDGRDGIDMTKPVKLS